MEERLTKAKWPGDADSPVMLMVDDFANVWIDLNGNGEVDPREDWGHATDSPNSSFRWLAERILKDYPHVKTTFFTPMARVPTIRNRKHNAHFGPINENRGIADFFRSVHQSEKFEIAYHGLTHGVSGEKTADFVQEWASYRSLEEALETIERGKRIYFEVFGEYPAGGKYCGYRSNSFSDESIDRSGFLWWCRRWDRGEAGGNNVERYDVRYFGKNAVVDIPSTVYGAMFNRPKKGLLSGALRKLGNAMRHENGEAELDYLLKNRLVISVQEHMSPARADGRRQTPNIFDDVESLRAIFEFLRARRAWYCTGTELAEYVCCRDNTKIDEHDDGFELIFSFGKDLRRKLITLIVNDERIREIRTPDGGVVRRNEQTSARTANVSGVFDLPIVVGKYEFL